MNDATVSGLTPTALEVGNAEFAISAEPVAPQREEMAILIKKSHLFPDIE